MRMPETVILGQVTSEVTLSSTGSKIGREKGVDDVDDEGSSISEKKRSGWS